MKTKTLMTLQAIAMYMEKEIKALGFNVNYEVKNVYADFGLGTTHDTVVSSDVNGNSSFQMFSPADMKKIEDDNFKPADAAEFVKKHAGLYKKWGTPTIV